MRQITVTYYDIKGNEIGQGTLEPPPETKYITVTIDLRERRGS